MNFYLRVLRIETMAKVRKFKKKKDSFYEGIDKKLSDKFGEHIDNIGLACNIISFTIYGLLLAYNIVNKGEPFMSFISNTPIILLLLLSLIIGRCGYIRWISIMGGMCETVRDYLCGIIGLPVTIIYFLGIFVLFFVAIIIDIPRKFMSNDED